MQFRRYTRAIFYGKKRLRIFILLMGVLSLPLLKYLYDFSSTNVWKGSWQKTMEVGVTQFSPLFWVSDATKHRKLSLPSLSPKVDFQVWSKWPLADKCSFYFKKSNQLDADFSCNLIREYKDVPFIDDSIIYTMMESLRIFDECFTLQDLEVSHVLVDSISSTDLHHRLYPFLSDGKNGWDEIWPEILDANSDESMDHTKYISKDGEAFKVNNRLSFWNNWKKYSKGKGIVMTIRDDHVRLLKRLIKVLDYKENSLPIQIVHKGNDLKKESIEDISRYVRENTRQQLYFVNVRHTINEDWSSYISGFSNKLLAVVFSTFEEVILLDADVVPFINISDFFTFKEYEDSGMLLFRDRALREYTSERCAAMFKIGQPSRQEKEQWEHELKLDVTHINTVDAGKRNTEEGVYHAFFNDRKLHHVDSGLVVIKRKEKLGSMLNSLMLALTQKVRACVYGDKEIFWLGQLLSADTFSVYPTMTGVVGNSDKYSQGSEKTICSAQMVHFSTSGEPLWLNGGLITCKLDNAAEEASEEERKEYERMPFNLEKLKDFYESTPDIQDFIIPDVDAHPWEQLRLCRNYFYCAKASEDYNTETGTGYKKLSDEQLRNIHGLQNVWFAA